MTARLSPLLRLGHLTESQPLGFSWRSSSVKAPVLGTRAEALSALRQVLGEYSGGDWQGYSVPTTLAHTPGPAFGFHTRTAEAVWKHAQQIADAHPKETTAAIVSKAIERAQVPVSELTPEDSKLLDMAVNWYLAGKVSGMEKPWPPPYGGNNTSGTQKNFPDSGSL